MCATQGSTVTRAAELPLGLADAAAVAVRGRLVVVGGAGARVSDAVYELTPSLGP